MTVSIEIAFDFNSLFSTNTTSTPLMKDKYIPYTYMPSYIFPKMQKNINLDQTNNTHPQHEYD